MSALNAGVRGGVMASWRGSVVVVIYLDGVVGLLLLLPMIAWVDGSLVMCIIICASGMRVHVVVGCGEW